ncbi:DUF6999 family protein [Crocinitomix catalasitica]|uniref:DUF6999 family protein n=1 Tax=Crocinitomix catalasitica TaxID=184607 RepID=UPI0004825D02|nr:hypothetical protein [Crocinitomix catalasitica]
MKHNRNDVFDPVNHDLRDPNPWLAMYLDSSIPMNAGSKKALVLDNDSRSRKYLMPMILVWSKITMFFFHIFKYFLPNLVNSSKILHRMLSWGLRRWVSPEANLLIFRHFHCGSEIVEFISKNIDGIETRPTPLKPYDFEDVKDDLFLNHDLNLYNFIINLNREMTEKNIQILEKDELDLSMITEDKFNMIDFPRKWTNILDLRSAIEVFTPFYQLFLTKNDFYRASNSLQLDETIGIYSAKILGSPAHLGLLNNKHPLVPSSTYGASYRLVLHGLASENLHEILVQIKQKGGKDGVIVTK